MKTLLIFNWFDDKEFVDLYLIDDAPEWLRECHNQNINSIRTPKHIVPMLLRVLDAIQDNPDYIENPEDELAGAWVDCKLKESEVPILDGSKIQVVCCGFIP